MATFIPLVGGGWLNLDHIVELLPAADGHPGRYEAIVAGQHRLPLVVERAEVEGLLGSSELEEVAVDPPPETPPVKPTKRRVR